MKKPIIHALLLTLLLPLTTHGTIIEEMNGSTEMGPCGSMVMRVEGNGNGSITISNPGTMLGVSKQTGSLKTTT